MHHELGKFYHHLGESIMSSAFYHHPGESIMSSAAASRSGLQPRQPRRADMALRTARHARRGALARRRSTARSRPGGLTTTRTAGLCFRFVNSAASWGGRSGFETGWYRRGVELAALEPRVCRPQRGADCEQGQFAQGAVVHAAGELLLILKVSQISHQHTLAR